MEFRLSATTCTGSYVFSAVLSLCGIGLTAYSFYESGYFALIGITLIAIAWYVFRQAKLSRLILGDNSITFVDSMSSITLALNNIKGFRKIEKGKIEILPLSGSDKKIIIGNNFENWFFIESWLEEHMSDVDAATIQHETEAILTNEDFGISTSDRETRLEQARRLVRILNISTYPIVLWAFIFPRPYNLVISLLLILPFIALAAIHHYKGVIQIADGEKSAYPSLISVVFIPPLIVAMMALPDYNIYDYSFLFKPLVSICAIAIIIAYLLSYEMLKYAVNRSMALITLIICMCCLAYGATIFFNSYLDKTTAQVFSVTVKDKYTSSGRRNRYCLNVEAWGRYTSAENIPVSSKLYKAENIGDTVNIYLKKGRLGIPWFWVEGNR